MVGQRPLPPLVLEGELVTSAYIEEWGAPCGTRHSWLGDAIYGRLYYAAPAFVGFVEIRGIRGIRGLKRDQ